MRLLSIPNPTMRCVGLLLATASMLGARSPSVWATPPDQPTSDSVGVIDGDAVAVTGSMSVEVVHGQAKTMLRSGSDVRVKSGTARIDLVEGGQISICGPAHFSVLKSGGSLTVALDTGTIHAHIENGLALTIYTVQIQAHTLAIGNAPQEVLAGFESPGTMCLRANRGAIRVEQQFTGQTFIIPQGGDVQLTNGQVEGLRSEAGHCACELQAAKGADPPPVATQTMTSDEARKDTPVARQDPAPSAVEKAPTKEEPIYEVYMPPLVYDAKAKVQPEVDPGLIVLVRRVRVRPTLIFQGRVEGQSAAVATAAVSPQKPASAAPVPAKPATPATDSFVDHMRNLVRKLWSR